MDKSGESKDNIDNKDISLKLIDNSSEAVCVLDTNGDVIYMNSVFRKLFGLKKGKARKFNFQELIHAEDLGKFQEAFKSGVLGGKEKNNFEFRMLGKDGSPRIVSYAGASVKKNGKVLGVQAILRDVTETKQLIEQIKRSKKHYLQVIDTIQDAICVINSDFKIQSCNKVFAEKVGMPVKEVKGKYCSKILPLFENGLFKNHCVKKHEGKVCQGSEIFQNGKEVRYVENNLDSQGIMRYHRISEFPNVDKEGKVSQVVMIIREVTEQVSIQEEVRRLSEFNKRILDNVAVSIMTINRDGVITTVNNYIKLFSKDANYIGKNIFKIDFFKKEGLDKKYRLLFDKGVPFEKDNCKTVSKDGKTMYLNIIAVPLKDENGRIEGAISLALDNTVEIIVKEKIQKMNEELEKRITERTWQLDKANKDLAKVLELQSTFISDASHELRTPLTIIQGNLDLAINEAKMKSKDVPEVLDLLSKEVRQMSSILSDLSMITSADANSEVMDAENVDLSLLLSDIRRSIKVLAEKKDIKLVYRKKIKEKFVVKGDEVRLERLFLNIARNAIKYTPKNGLVEIWLEKGKDTISVFIKDNGIGIPKADMPHIFNRFYRVDKARSREEGGTGLGLSICKLIAEAHGGKIHVDSTLGKGSTFRVDLPIDFRKGKYGNQLFIDLEKIKDVHS